jgi:hypothetical protein
VLHGSFIRCPMNVCFYSSTENSHSVTAFSSGVVALVSPIAFSCSVLIARDVAFIGPDDHRIDVVGKLIWDSGRGGRYETHC